MIQKMRYVTITGPIEQIDWVIEHYLGPYEIHLEYATQQLSEMPGLRAFSGDNPYQESAAQSEFFLKLLGNTPAVYFPMTGKQARMLIASAARQYEARSLQFKKLEESRDTIEAYIHKLRPFSALDADLLLLDKLKYIHCVFGRMPLNNFLQFEIFSYEETAVIFLEALRDQEYVWGCYFTLQDEKADEVNTLLLSYNFERIPINATCLNEEVPGAPIELIAFWERRLMQIRGQIQDIAAEDIPQKNALLAACRTVQSLQNVFAIKQYAARTASHYIFTGWMPGQAAVMLGREVRDDEETLVVHYEADAKKLPPTKLINPPGLRWFEFFVKLYGTPRYTEIDPTPILASAYLLFFGMMFGDVGHGLGLALLGWFLLSRSPLGGIMIGAGLSAAFFGFLYGSIFGMEDLLPALWRHPIQDITGTLLFAVVIGVLVILMTMALNMFNAYRQRDFEKLFFSPNGLAGLVLYITIFAAIDGMVHWSAACLPVAVIVLKGMSRQEKAGIAMTVFQRALGLFEILLAYLTNTISFVRIGAFALSHAGMMHVVLMLSQGTAESRNFLVLVLGNLIVMGIEGLLIGIQSLRLGFYEIFSRFYEGGGRVFESSVQK